jgi:microcystin-dependent protein
MSEPFIAEIRIVGFNFPPKGWAFCDGQILPISQNTALFSLLGTTYGGNGQTNFALPNLQGCSPMQPGQGPGLSLHDLGESGGSDTETLQLAEIPQHTHALRASGVTATTGTPDATVGLAHTATAQVYRSPTNPVSMAAAAIGSAGGGQPHNNRQPLLVFNFIIALQGIYPARS